MINPRFGFSQWTFNGMTLQLRLLGVKRAVIDERLVHEPFGVLSFYVPRKDCPTVSDYLTHNNLIGVRLDVRVLPWWRCRFKRFQHRTL